MTDLLKARRDEHLGRGWIGVDLDGTLAHYDKWVKWDQLGEPIGPMVERVRGWLAAGHEVRIMTARITPTAHEEMCRVSGERFTNDAMIAVIQDWCEQYLGERLEVTCHKDVDMIELWDDRAIQVITNTGQALHEAHEAELAALRGAP